MSLPQKMDTFFEGLKADLGRCVVVACSGGIDSMTLLNAVVRSRRFDEVWACYVHHGLHPQSQVHADFVQGEALRLGAKFKLESVDETVMRAGKGIEDGARRARYACLERCRLELGAEFVAVGHHRLDQLETFMIRLSQGSGIRGLSGMRGIRQQIIRPILDVTKCEIDAYAKAHNIVSVDDPTNDEQRFLRNSIRHALIPALDDALGAQWRVHLSQLMDEFKCRNEDDQRRTADSVNAIVVQREQGVSFPRECLGNQSELEAKLFIRATLETVLPSGTARRVQVNSVYEMATGGQSANRRNLGNDVWATIEYESMFLGRLPTVHSEHRELIGCGLYRWRDWLIGVGTPIEDALEVELPEPTEKNPMLIRAPQSGDHFWGRAGHRKLSRLLIDQKVPRRLRKETLMVAYRGVLVWGAGFGRSRDPVAREGAMIKLWIKPSRDFDVDT